MIPTFHQPLNSTASFFTRIIGGIDPERIWIDLCENQPAAKAKCQLFLQHYVQSSTELKSSLDVDGSGHESRSVNAASTVALLWKDLIGHANDVVLRKKRAEDPENAWRWTIKYSDVKQGKLCGPVNQITNVRLSQPAAATGYRLTGLDASFIQLSKLTFQTVDLGNSRSGNGSHAPSAVREEGGDIGRCPLGPQHAVEAQLGYQDNALHQSRLPRSSLVGCHRRLPYERGSRGGLPPGGAGSGARQRHRAACRNYHPAAEQEAGIDH